MTAPEPHDDRPTVGPTVVPTSVSPLNFTDLEARKASRRKLVVNEVTLREGEQGSGVKFSLAVKMKIARTLVALGVGQLQIGYPGRFEEDRDAARAVIKELPRTIVEVVALAFVKDWQREIDACASTGAQIIHVTNRSSERLRSLSDISAEAALERTSEAVRYACARAPLVTFAASDATRTELDYLVSMWKTATEAGAQRISVTDTVGVATPSLMESLVRVARDATGVPVGVHCHNDFGLAVANTLAGVIAGADVIDVAVNGLGDRAGNAPLEEVVTALALLYEIDTEVNLAALTQTSAMIAEVSRRPLPPNKPITGSAVFTHVLPTHIEAITRDARSLQPYEPGVVGNEQRLEPRR